VPDWQELVRQRLSGLALNAAERDDVHAELAAHLEETYEALLREGTSEPDAIHRALSQVTDWNDLQRKIYAARTRKDTMTNRVTQLWLPGFLTFTLSMGLLELVQKFGRGPIIIHLGHPPILMLYTNWLLALPLAGAIGAYLSHRAGGSDRMVLASSLFPVLPFVVVFLIAIPVGLVIGHSLTLAGFLTLIGWVPVPGVALLVGGLPTRFSFSRRSPSRGITVG